ncbi:MAG: AAA family ATPase [Gammaproteobacteria bacterium]|nr:AAA family ATPase [Gammaproteobacteria bacterium]
MNTTVDKSIIYRHLPLTLIRHWSDPQAQSPIWGEWLEGSLMHCDVTGFTAMSEALAKSGKEGAEFMASILNQFFERMLGIARDWDGIQMKFGGDAMLLYFGGVDHACRAAACGLDMQKAMKEFGNIPVTEENYSLRMRIGIHSGRFYSVSVGQENNLLHYMLLGHDVNKTADVEPMAEPGQVVVSNEARQHLDQHFKADQTSHANIWEIKRHNYERLPVSPAQQNIAINENLKRYLMPPIASGNIATLTGEHRRTTIVFIYILHSTELLASSGEAETLRQIHDYMNFVLDGIEKYGGYLITSDVSEHGDKLLIAFGAPVSCENQEENAVRFACELNQKLDSSYLHLKHQIGINTGHVFAGEIGSSARREFTTIGDTTNLAARLMAAADVGSIITSAATAEKCGDIFDKTALKPIRVKGKSQPISIYKINRMQEYEKSTLPQENTTPLFGREKQMEQLLGISRSTQAGHCSWIYMSGESGIGKSRLCMEFIHQLHNSGWLTLSGICQSYTRHTAYRAWYYPLRKIMGISLNDNNESAWQKITKTVEYYIPELDVFSPLIADMLVIENPGNAVVKSLDAKTRRDKRLYTIICLLEAVSKKNPVVIFFDNTQWIDSSSKDLVTEVLSLTSSPILFCLASREKLDSNLYHPQTSNLTEMELTELSNQDAKQLLDYYQVAPDMIDRIIERAKGNPLFLEELARSDTTSGASLPESVYDVIMARLDHLDTMKKSLLKNASVIGQIFDSAVLNGLPSAAKEFSSETGRA